MRTTTMIKREEEEREEDCEDGVFNYEPITVNTKNYA